MSEAPASEMTAAVTGGRPTQLRVAHVWRDEVMADTVLSEPAPVTLGEGQGCTFVVPAALGLPSGFAILRPGSRGYVLTLGDGMSGRIRLSGNEIDVEQFMENTGGVRAEGATGKFRATPVGSTDWGVIELDGRGEHNLFFQFVREDPPLPPSGWRDTELLLPALAFAVIMHAIFLVVSFALKDDGNDLLFPGRADLMTSYLINRPPPDPPPEPEKPQSAASEDGDVEKIKSATKGESGKSGGEGKKPRTRVPDPGEVPPEIQTGLLTKESRAAIQRATKNRDIDDKLKRSLSRLESNKFLAGDTGFGSGTGTGVGDGRDGTGTTRGGKGRGPGGGGSAQGDFVTQGKFDTGETRSPKGTGGKGSGPKEVKVQISRPQVDSSGLTHAEIQRVVESRKGFFKACYQKQLNRSRNLGGKVVVNFRIAANGTVKSTRVVRGKTNLNNAAVEGCIIRQIRSLKFPAKGGGVVNYPFIFSSR